MELMDYLTTRRSIRRYQDRPIPKETMEELIRIATLAPTGSGEQPWGFLVLDKKEEIDALSETIKAWLKENLEQYPWLARYEKWYTNPKFHVFNRAGTVLLIYGNTQSHWYVYDGSLAAAQVMAAGAEQGIGCCCAPAGFTAAGRRIRPGFHFSGFIFCRRMKRRDSVWTG